MIPKLASIVRLLAFFLCLNLPIAVAAEHNFPVTDISIAEQNQMMQNYCVMCHLDTAKNGGLSLEGFDAENLSPALAAILASKFTSGVPLEHLLESTLSAEVVEEIELGKKFGAPSVMNIAGLPLPAESEINGFIMAMAHAAEGADAWHIKSNDGVLAGDVVSVTSYPVRQDQGPRDVTFRLLVSCDRSSQDGEILLTWSPFPANGTVEVVVNEERPVLFELNQQEPMANGDDGTSAPSSIVLMGANKNENHPEISIPMHRLRVKGPLPTEEIAFAFDDLWEIQPEFFSSCF